MALVEMTFPCLDSCGGGYVFKSCLSFCETLIWMPTQLGYTVQTSHINPLCHEEGKGAKASHVPSRLVIYCVNIREAGACAYLIYLGVWPILSHFKVRAREFSWHKLPNKSRHKLIFLQMCRLCDRMSPGSRPRWWMWSPSTTGTTARGWSWT